MLAGTLMYGYSAAVAEMGRLEYLAPRDAWYVFQAFRRLAAVIKAAAARQQTSLFSAPHVAPQ